MAHDDVIADLAIACQSKRCLTQVLHQNPGQDAPGTGRLHAIPIIEAAPDPVVAPEPAPDQAALAPPPVAAEAADDKPEGERERLIWAMERCGWVQAKAARLLKISPRQMGYALRRHAIEVRKF